MELYDQTKQKLSNQEPQVILGRPLTQIFTNKITNWKQLGWKDLPIRPYITRSGSATYYVFKKIVLDGKDYKKCNITIPDSNIKMLVKKNEGAIGQLSLSFLINEKQINLIAPDGQIPKISNKNYPIYRNLHLTTKRKPKGIVKDFINWVLSKEGQKLISKYFRPIYNVKT